MPVNFPAIEPTDQPDFTMPEVPGSESVSVSGLRSYRQRGSRAVDAPLSLTFVNIPNATGELILAAYVSAGWIESLTIPDIVFNNAGPALLARLQTPGPGLAWFFAKGAPPTLERVKGSAGRLVTVQVRLRAELRAA